MTPDDFRILHKRLAAAERQVSALGRALGESIATMMSTLQQIDLAQQDLARRLTAVEAGQQVPTMQPAQSGYQTIASGPEHVNGG